MRIHRTIELSIPTPCSQNWEEMSVTEKGRFCDSCNKSVIDFTQYSDQQLVEFFTKPSENICGRLRGDQLNKSLYTSSQPLNYSLPKFLISATLAIGLSNNVHAKEEGIDPIAIHVSANEEKEEKKRTSTTGSDSTRYLSGTVTDQVTKETIPGVSIGFDNVTITTTTDVNGFFKLEIQDYLFADTIKLIFSSVGYITKTLAFTSQDFPLNSTIELVADRTALDLIPVMVGGIRYRPTLRQRLKHWLRIKNK